MLTWRCGHWWPFCALVGMLEMESVLSNRFSGTHLLMSCSAAHLNSCSVNQMLRHSNAQALKCSGESDGDTGGWEAGDEALGSLEQGGRERGEQSTNTCTHMHTHTETHAHKIHQAHTHTFLQCLLLFRKKSLLKTSPGVE